MWYYVKINNQFVMSPNFGKFELSPEKTMYCYMWETEAGAERDTRWQHLLSDGDEVQYVRVYRA